MLLDPRIIALSIAAFIGVIGVVMLFRGLRPANRGIRSCPKCRHLLSGTEGLRCPECGHLARSERVLLRANRRRASALFGLLFLAGSIFLAQRFDEAQQMFTLAPDRILVMLLPYASTSNSDEGIHAELYDRARSGMLGESAQASLLERIIAGDGAAAPGTSPWELKYAPLVHALRSRLDADDPLRERFAEIVPIVKATVPEEWPPEIPVVVLIDVTRFDSGQRSTEIRIDGLPRGSQSFKHHRLNRSGFPLALTLEQPGMTGVDRTLALAVDSAAEDAPAHERTIEVRIEPDRTLLAALEPRATPQMRRILEDSVFRFGVSLYEQGEPPWSLRFSPRSTHGDAFAAVLIGLEIELMRNGVPARRSLIWWHGGAGRAAWETVFEDRVLLEQARPDNATWTLRISGRKEIALRAGIGNTLPAAAWWSGSFEMPVEIRPTPGSIPPREWEPIRERANDDPTC